MLIDSSPAESDISTPCKRKKDSPISKVRLVWTKPGSFRGPEPGIIEWSFCNPDTESLAAVPVLRLSTEA